MSEPMPDGTEFLKCDAPGCDHFEMTPVTIDAVDKPCPKCGANLCTQQDYLDFRTLVAATKAANELLLKVSPSAPLVLAATNVHNGQIHRKLDPVVGVNPFPNDPVQS
jgi:hypothetical protein